MKLKYYLRGVGIGIIFATLVMTVSGLVHKYNITDEYIIKEARKLGMVMREELDNSGSIWGSEDSELTEETESTEVVSSESEAKPSESESESQSQTPPPQPSESESESESESQSESSQKTYVTIVIVRGDYARQVAEKMYAAGLVPDAEEFRKYIGAHGYGQSIRVGTYSIPTDATYEEICKIITTKP